MTSALVADGRANCVRVRVDVRVCHRHSGRVGAIDVCNIRRQLMCSIPNDECFCILCHRIKTIQKRKMEKTNMHMFVGTAH